MNAKRWMAWMGYVAVAALLLSGCKTGGSDATLQEAYVESSPVDVPPNSEVIGCVCVETGSSYKPHLFYAQGLQGGNAVIGPASTLEECVAYREEHRQCKI